MEEALKEEVQRLEQQITELVQDKNNGESQCEQENELYLGNEC